MSVLLYGAERLEDNMDVDIFREIIVPVIGGLGIFMLGLDFMANGIQAL